MVRFFVIYYCWNGFFFFGVFLRLVEGGVKCLSLEYGLIFLVRGYKLKTDNWVRVLFRYDVEN